MENLVGQRIKNRRNELKITQTMIQEKTSISSGNLSSIENGKYLPSAMALLELSRILNCSIDWILTGNSLISENYIFSDIKDDELAILQYFRILSEDDRDELLQIAKLKAAKQKRRGKSSISENDLISSNNIA